jgi:hypothetical protein
MHMPRRRLHRLTTTFFVVLSLLFSQLALASYVCPGQSDAEAMVAMAEAGQPCEGMDPAQPVLCHQHSADPAKTFEAVKLPVVGLPATVQVLELPSVLEAEAAHAVPPTATSEAQPPPDPIFLSTLRLRV